MRQEFLTVVTSLSVELGDIKDSSLIMLEHLSSILLSMNIKIFTTCFDEDFFEKYKQQFEAVELIELTEVIN